MLFKAVADVSNIAILFKLISCKLYREEFLVMKDLKISKLYDYYGTVLTDKQAEVVEQYYNADYSLKEISDNLTITRQAVHFALKQGVETLEKMEEKLGFLKKHETVINALEELKMAGAQKAGIDAVIELIRS